MEPAENRNAPDFGAGPLWLPDGHAGRRALLGDHWRRAAGDRNDVLEGPGRPGGSGQTGVESGELDVFSVHGRRELRGGVGDPGGGLGGGAVGAEKWLGLFGCATAGDLVLGRAGLRGAADGVGEIRAVLPALLLAALRLHDPESGQVHPRGELGVNDHLCLRAARAVPAVLATGAARSGRAAGALPPMAGQEHGV